ncbi:type VI secretion system baseplate subunit TssK [Aquimarina sp. RZ0]|uniref:type VI secretion system baseplate subunit TssK n=1 Tax=Aquimarina sp. RZ0 TaxID=2607730 RepID=UPI0011F1C2F4|nr:type VI secretion system baseplate subunit TssK [Aquimarina sp. RZ0]KAA1245331.1 hypothetical protein F0000_12485 [Aquimarina sp. RZ0]
MELINKNHHRVNWIDGMKINKNHFIEVENAFTSLIQQVGSMDINGINYGLLPGFGGEDAVDMVFSMDGQDTIKVQLNKCRAVTKGGYIINITPEISGFLEQKGSIINTKYQINNPEDEYYIVLSVNPYGRVPIGDADPEEEPPRHPFVLPEYNLTIIAIAEANEEEFGKHHITIGKIKLSDGTASLAEDFIPPCISIQSHQDLRYIYTEIHTFFNAIEKYTMNIIQKIYQKKQNNELATMVLTLTQNTLQYLGGMLPEFRLQDRHLPPVTMITKLMALARVIKNSMDVYVGTGKEELLNYLSDWCDLNQGAFENVLLEMMDLEYQHTDINKALYNVSSFTKLMLSLFKKLNELDYIGKKSDSNIFVKEEVIAKPDVKNRRSFLLD